MLVLTGLLVCSLAFLMVISPEANEDKGLFGNVARHAFTQQEMNALNQITDLADSKIAVDSIYYNMRYELGKKRFVDMSWEIASANFSSCRDKVVVVRNEILGGAFQLGDYFPVTLTYNLTDVLIKQGFTEVYYANDVCGYVYKNNVL